MADQKNNQSSGRGFASMDDDKQREIASKVVKLLMNKVQPMNLTAKRLVKQDVKAARQ